MLSWQRGIAHGAAEDCFHDAPAVYQRLDVVDLPRLAGNDLASAALAPAADPLKHPQPYPRRYRRIVTGAYPFRGEAVMYSASPPGGGRLGPAWEPKNAAINIHWVALIVRIISANPPIVTELE